MLIAQLKREAIQETLQDRERVQGRMSLLFRQLKSKLHQLRGLVHFYSGAQIFQDNQLLVALDAASIFAISESEFLLELQGMAGQRFLSDELRETSTWLTLPMRQRLDTLLERLPRYTQPWVEIGALSSTFGTVHQMER